MRKSFITAISCLTLSLPVAPALAEEADAELCLDCHVPVEDWEGMSVNEILAEAVNPDNPRHEGNVEIGEEQLRQIIESLMAQ